jgi:hypothetical protein
MMLKGLTVDYWLKEKNFADITCQITKIILVMDAFCVIFNGKRTENGQLRLEGTIQKEQKHHL